MNTHESWLHLHIIIFSGPIDLFTNFENVGMSMLARLHKGWFTIPCLDFALTAAAT